MEEGFEVALQAKSSGGPQLIKIDGEVETHVIALRLGPVPEGRNRWTMRLLAEKMVELDYVDSISYESIRQVLKKNELKPEQRIGWLIPPEQSAEFVCQMEAALDVYQRPYDPDQPLLCLDGSPKQLISEVRPPLTTRHGTTLGDYQYHRAGVCDLYRVCEPLAGRRYVSVRDTHTRLD